MNQNPIRISVRNLIEFILRQGSLDFRFTGNSRLVEGTRLHQKLQRSYGEDYRAEVPLEQEVEYRGTVFVLEGRADGIFTDDSTLVADEIKTTLTPLDLLGDDGHPLHWAQVKCYAYMLAIQNCLDKMGVQLTYYHADTGEVRRYRKELSRLELEQFVFSLLDSYLPWVELTTQWSLQRDASITHLKFPYEEYRKGQKKLMGAVYRTIGEEGRLFAQAPTGIGKTVSTLLPAVKALGEGKIEKIFYLTARTTTRQVAEEAFSRMGGQGLSCKSITLTAKEKICSNGQVNCSPEGCSCADGHFDRVNGALLDMLSHESQITGGLVTEYAEKHRVCPFEFALDLTLWCDCIICDYNYVFDPQVYLKRFFMTGKGNYAFLIDEAHNLADRAREMFSAEIAKGPFLKLKKSIKNKKDSLYKLAGRLNTRLLELRKVSREEGGDSLAAKDIPEDLIPLLKEFLSEAEKRLSGNSFSEGSDDLLELYFNINAFLKTAERYDESYVTMYQMVNQDFHLKLLCLDPSSALAEALKRGKTAVFFSATLTPLGFFQRILGGGENASSLRLPSPFPRENLCLMVADRISTRYRDREGSFDQIAGYIRSLVSRKTGNYMVFFPSYRFMEQVAEKFCLYSTGTDIRIQSSAMDERQRAVFLENFVPNPERTMVGFCVLGGVFSEGVDLMGDRLSGAVVVGVGLPQVNFEQNVMSEYYHERYQAGFEYAYMYPGMNKVLQAAGRVIRSERDRGVVLLVDDRFSREDYRDLFPQEWNGSVRIRSTAEMEKVLDEFWKEQEFS